MEGIDVPVIRGLCADIEQLQFAKPTSTTSNIATGQVGISFFYNYLRTLLPMLNDAGK